MCVGKRGLARLAVAPDSVETSRGRKEKKKEKAREVPQPGVSKLSFESTGELQSSLIGRKEEGGRVLVTPPQRPLPRETSAHWARKGSPRYM